MRTKHLCVLILTKLRVGLTPINMFKPFSELFTDRSKAVLLLWNLFVSYVSRLSFFVLSCLFLAALWSHAVKRADLLAVMCVAFSCVLSISQMCPGQHQKI